jgi:hypothetical protein
MDGFQRFVRLNIKRVFKIVPPLPMLTAYLGTLHVVPFLDLPFPGDRTPPAQVKIKLIN